MLRHVEFSQVDYSHPLGAKVTAQRQRDVDIPDRCPQCHYFIAPVILPSCYTGPENGHGLYVAVLQCQHCLKPFIAYYNGFKNEPIGVAPISPEVRSFDETITSLSPNFVSTYNQSLAAECMNLNEIAGMGFRKAIEYLIKDYLIMRFPEEADAVRSEFLGTCINNRVDNARLKTVASRAVWLGNDYAHYTRKYEDFDIANLKQFIDACLHWIQMELLTDQAENMDHR